MSASFVPYFKFVDFSFLDNVKVMSDPAENHTDKIKENKIYCEKDLPYFNSSHQPFALNTNGKLIGLTFSVLPEKNEKIENSLKINFSQLGTQKQKHLQSPKPIYSNQEERNQKQKQATNELKTEKITKIIKNGGQSSVKIDHQSNRIENTHQIHHEKQKILSLQTKQKQVKEKEKMEVKKEYLNEQVKEKIKQKNQNNSKPLQNTSESNKKMNQEQISIENNADNSDTAKQIAKKNQAKKVVTKKLKVNLDDYSEFIPEFLLTLNNVKIKNVMRVGKNYQANVPSRCNYSYLYRPLHQLKIWTSGEFNPILLKKFKEKFGQSRSQEDLCLLMYQYQCGWNQIWDFINQYKGELRKTYLVKDRTKS